MEKNDNLYQKVDREWDAHWQVNEIVYKAIHKEHFCISCTQEIWTRTYNTDKLCEEELVCPWTSKSPMPSVYPKYCWDVPGGISAEELQLLTWQLHMSEQALFILM